MADIQATRTDPMRTLLIFIALALIFMIGKRLVQKPRAEKRTQPLSGKMVRCAHCGIYIPENEAFEQAGHSYCSREHRDAGHKQT